MNITISSITTNKMNFRATKKDETSVVAKENKKPLSYQKLSEKRTTIALGCCLIAALAVDVLYFAMKRNIKYEKIHKKQKLAQELQESFPKRPLTTFEFFEANKDRYGEDAKEKFMQIVTNGKHHA